MCEHGEITEHELPWFNEKDNDYKTLQKLVLDPRFLDSLKFYTRFSHTGELESFHNLSLSYASKRRAFW